MNLKISILLPTLGMRESEIKRLLDSLVEQTYTNLEIVIVVQGNFGIVQKICDLYLEKLNIIIINTNEIGLSKARNLGLKYTSGDIVILSDDDCWYHKNSVKIIADFFIKHPELDILLTQIFDPVTKEFYKQYSGKSISISGFSKLLSRSSIEIAFKKKDPVIDFDILFGLGGKYVSGEETDYLIRALKQNKRIHYEPIVTVFHKKKKNKETKQKLIAKGAFYSKNFGFFISNMVLLRDLVIKHQNNYRWFWNGYFDYKKYE